MKGRDGRGVAELQAASKAGQARLARQASGDGSNACERQRDPPPTSTRVAPSSADSSGWGPAPVPGGSGKGNIGVTGASARRVRGSHDVEIQVLFRPRKARRGAVVNLEGPFRVFAVGEDEVLLALVEFYIAGPRPRRQCALAGSRLRRLSTHARPGTSANAESSAPVSTVPANAASASRRSRKGSGGLHSTLRHAPRSRRRRDPAPPRSRSVEEAMYAWRAAYTPHDRRRCPNRARGRAKGRT